MRKSDPSTTILEGHKIGHEVKETLIASNPRIQDVIVHLEPARVATIVI